MFQFHSSSVRPSSTEVLHVPVLQQRCMYVPAPQQLCKSQLHSSSACPSFTETLYVPAPKQLCTSQLHSSSVCVPVKSSSQVPALDHKPNFDICYCYSGYRVAVPTIGVHSNMVRQNGLRKTSARIRRANLRLPGKQADKNRNRNVNSQTGRCWEPLLQQGVAVSSVVEFASGVVSFSTFCYPLMVTFVIKHYKCYIRNINSGKVASEPATLGSTSKYQSPPGSTSDMRLGTRC